MKPFTTTTLPGLACPICRARITDVVDSRPDPSGHAIRRRRRCEKGHRFTTYEQAEIVPILAKKKRFQIQRGMSRLLEEILA